MKILHISNNPNIRDKRFEKILWNGLLYPLKKKVELLDLGKKDLLGFYFRYLKFKPDIIVSTWIPAGFIPVFFKKIGLIKCPIVHRWEDYYTESMTNYPKFIVNFMENYTAKNADYIITVLKTLYERAKYMNKKVFLLPYGITPGDKKTKINLNKLKSRKDNLKVIYLGEINSLYKRVDKIIEATKENKCDLFLFGEQPSQYIKNIAQGHGNIHFMGWADNEEVADILKQGDILVNTANHDISMKFLDYINARKPILALNDKPKNLFKHKETAYLTDDFRKGLRELIKNKKLREKIKKNLKEIKIYSWKEVADIHIRLYEKILNNEDVEEFETGFFHVPV